MQSMVEGQVRGFLTLMAHATPRVPLHQLRWSPSPIRGGL